MANPYSNDLRNRIIQHVERGVDITELAQAFEISRMTIYRWIKLKAQQGHVKAKQNWRQGHSHTIKNMTEFLKFVRKHVGMTLKELAQAWGEGSAASMRRALVKAGFTHKKNNGWIPGTQRRSQRTLRSRNSGNGC